MINFFSNTWSNFVEWKDRGLEQTTKWLDHNWDYYIQDRGIIKGLPIAVISSVAAGYLFQCAKPSSAAIFGVVNYIALTSSIEIIRAHEHIDNIGAGGLWLINGAISLAFLQTVCKTTMTYQTAAILAAAAFTGQVARAIGMQEE